MYLAQGGTSIYKDFLNSVLHVTVSVCLKDEEDENSSEIAVREQETIVIKRAEPRKEPFKTVRALLFKRPGVAGAVLQTTPSLIH